MKTAGKKLNITPGKNVWKCKIASENQNAAKKASDTYGYYYIEDVIVLLATLSRNLHIVHGKYGKFIT